MDTWGEQLRDSMNMTIEIWQLWIIFGLVIRVNSRMDNLMGMGYSHCLITLSFMAHLEMEWLMANGILIYVFSSYYGINETITGEWYNNMKIWMYNHILMNVW